MIPNKNKSLSLKEIEEFIAQTRDIVPEKVVSMLKERELQIDESERRGEVFLPLIEDVRKRLNERGLSDPNNITSNEGLDRKTQILLESLAYLLNGLAHGYISMNDMAEEARQLAKEAEFIGRLLGDRTIITTGNDILASYEDKVQNTKGAIARYRESYAIGVRENDTDIIARSLHNLGALFIEHSRYAEAIEVLNEAYSKLKVTEGRVGAKGFILIRLASAHQYSGDVVKSIEFLSEAEQLLKDNGNEFLRLRVLSQFAFVYRHSNQYAEAIKKFQEAIAIADTLSDYHLEAENLVGLARVYSAIGESEEGLKLLRAAVQKFKENDATNELSLVEARFGDMLASEGRYKEALSRYERSLQLLEQKAYHASGLSYVYTAMGDMLTHLKEYDKAEEKYQRGLEIVRETGLHHAIHKIHRRLADIARVQGKRDQAIALYLETLDLIEEEEVPERVEVHRWLAELYKRSDDYRNALMHHEEYHRLKMILQERLLDEELNALRITHRVDGYQKEAELERLQRQQSETELQQATLELTEKGELLGSVRKQIRDVLKHLENEQKPVLASALRQVLRHVSEQSSMNERTHIYLRSVDEAYYERLQEQHPDLTSGQVRLCGLLRSGMNNPDIADVLHITISGLNKQRYRLRRVLGLTRRQRLEQYLMGI